MIIKYMEDAKGNIIEMDNVIKLEVVHCSSNDNGRIVFERIIDGLVNSPIKRFYILGENARLVSVFEQVKDNPIDN